MNKIEILVGEGGDFSFEMLEVEHRRAISQNRRKAGAKGGSVKVSKGLSNKQNYLKAFEKRKQNGFSRSCSKK